MKIFKVLEPIGTMFQGRFPYYYREPFGAIFRDGYDCEKELEIEEIDIDLNKLFVEIKVINSPFTGKPQNYYFFTYENEDIYIEDYDSTSETFVEKIVKQLKKENITR